MRLYAHEVGKEHRPLRSLGCSVGSVVPAVAPHARRATPRSALAVLIIAAICASCLSGRPDRSAPYATVSVDSLIALGDTVAVLLYDEESCIACSAALRQWTEVARSRSVSVWLLFHSRPSQYAQATIARYRLPFPVALAERDERNRWSDRGSAKEILFVGGRVCDSTIFDLRTARRSPLATLLLGDAVGSHGEDSTVSDTVGVSAPRSSS